MENRGSKKKRRFWKVDIFRGPTCLPRLRLFEKLRSIHWDMIFSCGVLKLLLMEEILHQLIWRIYQNLLHLPRKFNSSPLKNHGWKMNVLVGFPILRGYVKFPGCI